SFFILVLLVSCFYVLFVLCSVLWVPLRMMESINDLHQVLERLQNNKFPVLRKKHGYLPACDPGEQCALRIGSRIGKLCDCSLPRTCNSFLHRCL
uniref:Cocaine- and amphetamine-regulated transcript protein n=1 Tax=Nothobranchius furzeri TaxID=105023 RepID=A0A8C6PFE4_NOTFU